MKKLRRDYRKNFLSNLRPFPANKQNSNGRKRKNYRRKDIIELHS